MTFSEILADIRKKAFSEHDKGHRFERLMRAYLLTDPLYANDIDEVWLWADFPFRKDFSGKDTGIDLVAKTSSGDYWAIQCKCYAEDTYIDKASVDTFLSTSGKQFQNDKLEKIQFSHRLWIATTSNWSTEANHVLLNQQPPVTRINLTDLENAPVDWDLLLGDQIGQNSRLITHKLRKHQQDALDKAHKYFQEHDRGKMIMACGTGKTFTSLRLAEQETDGKGLVLFLVPSISLLGQTLREWSAQANERLKAICVCSDAEVSKAKKNDDSGDSIVDLALPASTHVNSIVNQLKQHEHDKDGAGMTVVFSTYQSIDRVSSAQKKYGRPFDLIICDEAHRTTGVTLADDEESAFVKVHDNGFIKGDKRVYMTATPRIYGEDAKTKAKDMDAVLCSMDNPDFYGEEFYRIGFGKAVEKYLLSDYKVLILTVHEDSIPKEFQQALTKADNAKEINADDVMKLAGCINALSKTTVGQNAADVKYTDSEPMRKAVAFCQSIKASKTITAAFNTYKDLLYSEFSPEERELTVDVTADHVDGTMSALTRDSKLTWLKTAPSGGRECRILSNVRCLSEGVDVPSLDAVLFLSPRNSQVDVVQSVGRVMRTVPGKNYGYIIIPVIIPAGTSPEEALDDNERFKVVWAVLNALRAHDDRFDAIINKINLNKRLPSQVQVIDSRGGSSAGQSWGDEDHRTFEGEINKKNFADLGALCHCIFARMVEKVGSKKYWEQWARDVAKIAERHIEEITAFVNQGGPQKDAFEQFLKGLHQNINPSVTQDEAIQMLAQHLITKPVFDALFENYRFVENNPVSKAMQDMLDKLDALTLERDRTVLNEFYESVKMRTSDIDNGKARQQIIIELYDKFFRTAFPKVVEKLGIVYTPVEVVDFIIRSVADVLKAEFDRDISDENIHILDPFTGTGTFITRLIQSGLIKPEALDRKYGKELHANEIVLLAYYIASINIENAYHECNPDTQYKPFEGICLTDTFQLGESIYQEQIEYGFEGNTRRVLDQLNTPIRIIIGNPPYSVGQKSANDNAQNQRYPKLEERIESTYVKESEANLSKAAYDSYVKAFRWSTDRLGRQGGIIAFVSGGGWLDGKALDGTRKALEKEFSTIYVFNLRGDQRTKGDESRREGGKIFGSGSRSPITITLFVKKPAVKSPAAIFYHDIGDYLSREQKLEIISSLGSIDAMKDKMQRLEPNKHGDWISLRDEDFDQLIPLAPIKKFEQKSQSFFTSVVIGISTNRDAWVYNFSLKAMMANMKRTINYYNSGNRKSDPLQISWTRGLRKDAEKGVVYKYSEAMTREILYRPFCKQNIYSIRDFIEMPGLNSMLFPNANHDNIVISITSGARTFSCLLASQIVSLDMIGGTQCFPLYYYEEIEKSEYMNLFDTEDEYTRRDGISDFILDRVRDICGPKVTKKDIFYYVYGILHSEQYRAKYAVNLKKGLPRLPLPETSKLFWAFSKAGRELAEMHLNYETLPPYPDVMEEGKTNPSYRVEKMHFANRAGEEDKTSINYNKDITLWNIPIEAYDYIVNGKSAIEWIMERYQVTKHKESGIVNDPNDWCEEHGNPRYILDLLKSIVTLSVKTREIVRALPELSL